MLFWWHVVTWYDTYQFIEGPGKSLYTTEFYELLKSVLRPGGAVAVQGGSFFWFKGVFNTVYHQLNKVFPMVRNTSITDRNQYDALVCLIFAFVIFFL